MDGVVPHIRILASQPVADCVYHEFHLFLLSQSRQLVMRLFVGLGDGVFFHVENETCSFLEFFLEAQPDRVFLCSAVVLGKQGSLHEVLFDFGSADVEDVGEMLIQVVLHHIEEMLVNVIVLSSQNSHKEGLGCLDVEFLHRLGIVLTAQIWSDVPVEVGDVGVDSARKLVFGEMPTLRLYQVDLLSQEFRLFFICDLVLSVVLVSRLGCFEDDFLWDRQDGCLVEIVPQMFQIVSLHRIDPMSPDDVLCDGVSEVEFLVFAHERLCDPVSPAPLTFLASAFLVNLDIAEADELLNQGLPDLPSKNRLHLLAAEFLPVVSALPVHDPVAEKVVQDDERQFVVIAQLFSVVVCEDVGWDLDPAIWVFLLSLACPSVQLFFMVTFPYFGRKKAVWLLNFAKTVIGWEPYSVGGGWVGVGFAEILWCRCLWDGEFLPFWVVYRLTDDGHGVEEFQFLTKCLIGPKREIGPENYILRILINEKIGEMVLWKWGRLDYNTLVGHVGAFGKVFRLLCRLSLNTM